MTLNSRHLREGTTLPTFEVNADLPDARRSCSAGVPLEDRLRPSTLRVYGPSALNPAARAGAAAHLGGGRGLAGRAALLQRLGALGGLPRQQGLRLCRAGRSVHGHHLHVPCSMHTLHDVVCPLTC